MTKIRFGTLLLLSITLGACATAPDGAAERASVQPPEPVASSADPAGRITGYQFARRYDDVVKIDGKDVRQSVEYGFDYQQGKTVRRIYDIDGKLMSEEAFAAESLRANPAEEARMLELVKTHPQLGPLMAEPNLLVHSGGFVVREPDDPYCGLGSRCMRVIVSKGDGSINHIHAVVDLVSDRVVHPFYDDQTPAVTGPRENLQ